MVARAYTALNPGEVAVVEYDAASAAGSDPAVRRLTTGDDAAYASGTVGLLGVCVLGAAVGQRAVIATHGIVPRLYTGIAAATAGVPAAGDLSTGRVRAAATGEVVLLGTLDTRGNLHLR